MNVIFLDIDGVLQPYNANKRFEVNRKILILHLIEKHNVRYDQYNEFDVAAVYCDWDIDAIKRIKRILEETDSKIVISSNWRNSKMPNKMKDLLAIHGLDKYYHGITREFNNIELFDGKFKEYSYKIIEILDYLEHNKDIDNYVIIDDLDLLKGLEGHFVKTNNVINEEDVRKCIKILKKS